MIKDDDRLFLGAVVDGWICVDFFYDGPIRSARLVKIPEGETEYGLGRTWDAAAQPDKLVFLDRDQWGLLSDLL